MKGEYDSVRVLPMWFELSTPPAAAVPLAMPAGRRKSDVDMYSASSEKRNDPSEPASAAEVWSRPTEPSSDE